jgi:hypothetical protein
MKFLTLLFQRNRKDSAVVGFAASTARNTTGESSIFPCACHILELSECMGKLTSNYQLYSGLKIRCLTRHTLPSDIHGLESGKTHQMALPLLGSPAMKI